MPAMAQPNVELLADIERSKAEQAIAMDAVSRALAGAKLFDALRDRLAWGVLIDEPEADDAIVKREVRRRIAELRRAEAEA